MNAERIKALPLTKAQALEYAQIAVRQKLGKPAEKVRYLCGGSFGRAVSVLCKDGQTLVVKFLLAEDMMQKEVHDLELLAGYSPVRVPRVFFARPGDEKIPVDCYGMEEIKGKSSLFALGMLFLGKRSRREFADRVTRHCTPSIPANAIPSATRWMRAVNAGSTTIVPLRKES